MKYAAAKFIGFYTFAFVLLMYTLAQLLPGFIPSYYYLTPFIIAAVITLLYAHWKRPKQEENKLKKISWISFALTLAVLGGLMYKVSARFGLPFWGFVLLLCIFLIISGTLFYYERGYSRRRKSDALASSHVGDK
jgi:O-antigen/teichoic acid export membrane protein